MKKISLFAGIMAFSLLLPLLAAAQVVVDADRRPIEVEKMLGALAGEGIEMSDSELFELTEFSAELVKLQNKSNEYASANSNKWQILNKVLVCVKAKVALVMVGEVGVCTDTTGKISRITGTGIGLSIGASASLIALVHSAALGSPVAGTYRGAGLSAAMGQFLEYTSKFPRMLGPTVGFFSRADGASLAMLGLELGPVLDISTKKLTLK